MEDIAWHKERQKGIGSSDVAAILGLSKWKTPSDVWLEKVSEEPIIAEETPLMKAGLILEDAIAEWWEDESARKVRRDKRMRWHKSFSFLFADLDRTIVAENGDGPGVLECKNVSEQFYRYWPEGAPHAIHWAQVQHQLDVTGYNWGEIGALIGGHAFIRFPIEPDREWINYKNEELEHFWFGHVQKGIPPEPITHQEANERYKALTLKEIEAVELTYRTYEHAKVLQHQLQEMEEALDQKKLQLKLAMQDAEIMTYQGDVIVTWKEDKKGKESFDKAGLKKKYPKIYLAYSTTKEPERRLLLK
jgi:putative phage-type endonuclease